MHAIEKQLLWRRIIRGVGLALGLLVQTAGANEVQSDIFVARSTLELTEPAEVLKCRPNRTEAESMIKICALRPSGPYSVTIELKNGWKFLDNATVRTVECQLTEEVFLGVVRGSEGFQLLYLCDSDHVNTMELEAEDAWAHRIFLYPNGKPGVVVEPQDIKWKCVENAYHRRTGQIPFNTYQLKTGYVCRPIADDGVKPVVENGIFSKGHYEEDYTADWTWRGCETDECRTHAVFEAEADVYRLSLVNGAKSGTAAEALGLGLDMTDAGKAENRGSTFPIEAVIEDEYEHKKEFRWSVGKIRQDKEFTTESVINLDVEREKDEPHLPTLFGKSGPVESESLTCEARISGCHETCVAEATVSTNVTVVGVDVTIAMADCEKKTKADELLGYAWSASEETEETQGAFIHYEDDHGMVPFSPRGSNALVRVWFTVKPDNLPKDDKVRLSFPEGALWEGTRRRGNAFYRPAEKEYTVSKLKNKSFFLHGHKPSEKICDHEITIEHVKSGAKDRAKYTVVELDLVPDFDRDHKIDADDEKKVVQQKTFYWWINDDADEGDCASCYADKGTEVPNYPSLKNNCDDGSVNGRTDLLDFFPVWTNIGGALEICKKAEAAKSQKLSIRLKTKGIGFAQTNMHGTEAGKFLKSEGVDAFEAGLFFKSDTVDDGDIRKDGEHEFRKEYINHCIGGLNKAGVILVEGCKKETDVRIALYRGDKELFNVPMNCSIHSVDELFGILDLYMTGGSYKAIAIKEFEEQCSDCDVFYLHGFKVHQSKAIGWHADAFKRLYQSGSTARFIGVTWNGYVEARHPGLYYHRCVMQAFEAGKRLATYLNEGKIKRRNKSVFMAHSLGNVVVSTAIQDYQLKPTQYFMLNAAVAAEAYDGRLQSMTDPESTYLVQENWWSDNLEEAMPKQAFSAYWHQFFVDEQSSESYKNGTKAYRESVDCRARLTWKDRFAEVLTNTVVTSYYSPQDEVFEICKDRGFWQGEGFKAVFFDEADYEFSFGGIWEWFKNWIDLDLSQYCWHKQEVGKGMASVFNQLADSDMAGWGFAGENPNAAQTDPSKRIYTNRDIEKIKQKKDWLVFKDEPAFRRRPLEVFRADGNAFDKAKENEMLACAIPAMSRAMGRSDGEYLAGTKFKDVVDVKALVNKENECRWGRDVRVYGKGWLHCDIKDMAYFYTWPLWNDFVKRGELRDEEVFK